MSRPQINSKLPDSWPFDQAPNCAVFTTTHVLQDGQPITHVFHDEVDYGWQFHYGGETTLADAMIVALQEIYFCDPTIAEVADLLPGWKAIREAVGKPWRKEKIV